MPENTIEASIPLSNTGAPASAASGGFLDNLFAAAKGETPAAPVAAPVATPEPTPALVTPEPVAAKIEAPKVSDKKGMDALLEDVEEPVVAEEDDGLTPPEGTVDTPKAKNAWTALKTDVKVKSRQIETLQAETARLKAEVESKSKLQDADPLKKELEAVKAEREQLAIKAYAHKVEESPEYIKEVQAPVNEILASAKAMAERTGVDYKLILNALDEPDTKKQDELLTALGEDLNPREQARLNTMADRMTAVTQRDVELRKNAAEVSKELKARETQQAEEKKTASKAAEMRAVSDNVDKLKKIATQFSTSENPEAELAALADSANAVPFDEMPVESKAFAAVAALALPMMQRVLKASKAEVESLKREMKALTGTAPGVSEGQKPAVTPAFDPNVSMFDQIADKLGRPRF